MEGAAEEDAVDRADHGVPGGRHGRQRQQAHPLQPLAELLGGQPALRRVDAQQVRAGVRIAAVEQLLQCGEVLSRLVHRASIADVGSLIEFLLGLNRGARTAWRGRSRS